MKTVKLTDREIMSIAERLVQEVDDRYRGYPHEMTRGIKQGIALMAYETKAKLKETTEDTK